MVKLSSAIGQYRYTNASGDHQAVASGEYSDLGIYTVSAPVVEPFASAAQFNADFAWETGSGLPGHISDFTSLRGNPVLPHGGNVLGTVRWQLDSGAAITPHKGVITYSFLDSSNTTGMYNRPQEGFTEGAGFTPFTSQQRAAAGIAIQNWDDLVAVTFKQVNGSGGADITLANTFTGPAQAHAYIPYDYADIYSEAYGPQYNAFHRYAGFTGDVWVADPRVNSSNAQLEPGQYGLQTLNHELGHSLGLSHPGAYDFGDDNDGDGEPDPITYDGDAFYFQDSNQFTIMSYFDSFETGAQNVDWNVLRFIYPSTPMVDDVFVIQQKYGADMTTRTGNTVYGFNSTADVTNEAMKFHTGEMATIFTIWDAKGNDTLDLSGYYTDSVIDLREGAYSSAGGWGAYDPALLLLNPGEMDPAAALVEINANNADAGFGARTAPKGQPADYFYQVYFNGGQILRNQDGTPLLDEDGNEQPINEGLSWKAITGTGEHYLMEQNIGIAYGAVIENAIGGGGADRINGNDANNTFTGNGGADTFILADYSGDIIPLVTGGTRTVEDRSVDTITDFKSGVDKLDLSSFAGVTEANIHWNAETHTLSVDANLDHDFTDVGDAVFIIQGTDVVSGDYIFAS